MYQGLSSVNINAGGRIAIPTKYRDDIDPEKKGMVLTVSHSDPCLVLYPMDKWLDAREVLAGISRMSRGGSAIRKMLVGHATEVEMDGSGRIIIPTSLREYADLEKKLAFVGQLDTFEIWNQDKWDESRDDWAKELPSLIENDENLRNVFF